VICLATLLEEKGSMTLVRKSSRPCLVSSSSPKSCLVKNRGLHYLQWKLSGGKEFWRDEYLWFRFTVPPTNAKRDLVLPISKIDLAASQTWQLHQVQGAEVIQALEAESLKRTIALDT
jgi:hypothetical protein